MTDILSPRRWLKRPALLTVCAALAAGTALGDIRKHELPRDEEDEGPPKVLRHIGNFFFNLANKLEDSGLPRPPLPPFFDPPPHPTRKSNPPPKAPMKLSPPRTRYADEPDERREPSAPIEKKSSKVPPKLASPPPETFDAVPAPKLAPEKPKKKATDDTSGVTNTPEQMTVKPEPNQIPTAGKTNKSGRVKSPFPPFTELDVTGLGSGSLAKDPTTGRVFRVP